MSATTWHGTYAAARGWGWSHQEATEYATSEESARAGGNPWGPTQGPTEADKKGPAPLYPELRDISVPTLLHTCRAAGCPVCENPRRRPRPPRAPPPRPPPSIGRRAPEGTAWSARVGEGRAVGELPEDVRAAYALALWELRAQGRRDEARVIRRCSRSASLVWYWCPEHGEPHAEVRGTCKGRSCPICGDRAYRQKREKAWKSLGPSDWAWYWVVTIPPELRHQHTPEAFTPTARALAKWVERWFMRRGLRPVGFVAAHWTGERTASAGVFHPHYNILVTSRAIDLATGEMVHLRDRPDLGIRPNLKMPIETLQEWRIGLSAAAGVPESRAQARLERKSDPERVAHAVEYILRPHGDGVPDMRVRWSWRYYRHFRPFGAIATGRAASWAELNPHDPNTETVLPGPINPCDSSRSVCVQERADGPNLGTITRAALAQHIETGTLWLPDRALDNCRALGLEQTANAETELILQGLERIGFDGFQITGTCRAPPNEEGDDDG